MTNAVDETPGSRALILLFCAAVAVHCWLATGNWRSGFMPGHEFRQSQTAIISYYIDRESNFTLQYPDPVLGKPWTFPMEFPLYEWSVVAVKRLTHASFQVAGRTVSLGCFYLILPAVYLLLAGAGLGWPHRILTLVLILACPVYIFYSRAVLMESMAVMFCAWFLAAFVRTLQTRRIGWLALCTLAGTAGALVKSTTFFVWLVPAFGYGAWRLWRAIRDEGWGGAAGVMGWGFGAVLAPAVLLTWWVHYTDAIKAAHSSAYIFTSENLTHGNFGMYEPGARFSRYTWRNLLDGWRLAIVSPWLIGGFVAAGAAVLRRERRWVLGAAALFLAAQLLFPYAYALQEYYFYACAVFVLAALGFVLGGVIESRLPRPAAWLIVAATIAAFLSNYLRGYRSIQMVPSNGGSGMTEVLRDHTPVNDVLVVAGDDWSPIIPFFSQRKALMIRRGLDENPAYLERAFHDLADEEVAALVLVGDARGNKRLVDLAAKEFNLDWQPTFSHATADVYMNRTLINNVLRQLARNAYDQVKVPDRLKGQVVIRDTIPVLPDAARRYFGMVSPLPLKFKFDHGYSLGLDEHGHKVLITNPDSDLWVPAPAGPREVAWDYGIFPGAYEHEGPVTTDGVEFIVVAEADYGGERPLYYRLLDPVAKPADRGTQHVTFSCELHPGESLIFRTRAGRTGTYDWAYMGRVEVK